MRVWPIVLALTILSVAPASAQDSLTREVLGLVQDACRGSSVTGSKGQDDGSTRVAVPGSSEEVTFSRSEWSGIQQVLREHQAQDNESYRRCVADLSPVFLKAEADRAAARPAAPDEGFTAAPDAFCDFENDGECDVPDLCPAGTDLADCAGAAAADDAMSVWDRLRQQTGPQAGQGLFCCDMFGNKWCPMVAGATFAGDACFCAGVPGSGFQCY